MSNIFAFGTLMYPRIVHALIGVTPQMQHAVLSGYRRGRIVDPAREAKGPAIAADPASSVSGKVVFGLDDRQARIIDLFEDAAGGYAKQSGVARLLSGGAEVPVSFYVASKAIEKFVSSEDWSEEQFERQHHDHYVDERIPALLSKWTSEGLLDKAPR